MIPIHIENISVGYGKNLIIDDQSISIPSGSFFTLLGPSGCGKTTFLRLIAGFLSARNGKILFGDNDVTRTPAHQRGCGVVFQDYALFPDRSVFENVAYGLRARGIKEREIKQQVGQYLERVGLADFAERSPAALSGGQRQRVALARALVIQPQVLLLDEPLSALDAKLAIEMQSFVRDIQQEFGVTTIFVTHDQRMALTMSDQIALLRSGRVEQIGSPQSIYSRPKSSYVADFIGSANLIEPETVQLDGEKAHCTLAGMPVTVARNNCVSRDKVHLCIREEALKILPLETGISKKDNTLPAHVERVIYMGEAYRIELRLSNGALLKAQVQSGFDAYIPGSGQDVILMVSKDACLVKDGQP